VQVKSAISAGAATIRIELKTPTAQVFVDWPLSDPAACVVWLRELMR
jgi:hypothetical protein